MTTPMYRRIAQELRQQIKSGHLGPGEQLPTELELGERYEASRNTVRDAIKWLTAGGLVETRPGQGTFVRRLTRAPYPPSPLRERVILLRCTDPIHPSIQAIPTFGTFWDHLAPESAVGLADRRARAIRPAEHGTIAEEERCRRLCISRSPMTCAAR